MDFKIIKYGPEAFLIQFEDQISFEIHQRVRFLYEGLRRFPEGGIKSVIPAYNSLTVQVQTELIEISGFEELCLDIIQLFDPSKFDQYKVIIPVCYDDEFSIDLPQLIKHTGLSKKEIIKIHTQGNYLVYMLGFVPGFLYLGGMSKLISCPRLTSPRLKIPKGSVAIGGDQTGVYPVESPGGWQIIGGCPLDLIGTGKSPLIEMGDQIEFKEISKSQYLKMKDHSPQRILINGN